MSELSREARSLIEMARAEEAPSASHKARVLGRLVAALPPLVGPPGIPHVPPVPTVPPAVGPGIGAAGAKATAIGTGAAKAAATGTAALAAKVKLALVIAAVSAGSAGTWIAIRTNTEPRGAYKQATGARQVDVEQGERHQRRHEQEVAVPAANVLQPIPPPPTVVPTRPRPASRTTSGKSATQPQVATPKSALRVAADEPGLSLGDKEPNPTAPSQAIVSPSQTPPVTSAAAVPPASPTKLCTVRDELSLLGQAQAALHQGQPKQALVLLARQAACHQLVFNEELRAARVLALCQLGLVQEAGSEATMLQQEAPRSPHLGRLRGTCAAPALSHSPRR
jgi:hypothetical protein